MTRISSLAGRRIGFVTFDALPDLSPADQLPAELLREGGTRVDAVVWTNELVGWQHYDAIVVRSTWDYHLQHERFLLWLDSLEKSGTRIFNPLPVLRWNIDKHYLVDLQNKNIRIPRTMLIEMGESFDLERLRSVFSNDEVVIKPAISASAWETKRVHLSKLSLEELEWIASLRSRQSLIIQEFMPEIVSEGEWSFIFFGSSFSHAVLKRPAGGDFRVQDELGGSYSLKSPHKGLVEQAARIVRAVEDPLLYARVDAVVREEKLYLMELELVEPTLYFDANPASANAFCERLASLFN